MKLPSDDFVVTVTKEGIAAGPVKEKAKVYAYVQGCGGPDEDHQQGRDACGQRGEEVQDRIKCRVGYISQAG